MPSWGYFFAGLAFTTIAAFSVVMTFLLLTPAFSGMLNAFGNVATNLGATAPYNTLTFIAQGNQIYMAGFSFIMIGLAFAMFYIAFTSEPDETVQNFNVDF